MFSDGSSFGFPHSSEDVFWLWFRHVSSRDESSVSHVGGDGELHALRVTSS